MRVRSGEVKAIKVYPTIVSNNNINIDINQPVTELQIINTNGAVVYRKNLRGTTGNLPLTLPVLPKGVYVLRVGGPDIDVREKIIIQ